MPEESCRTCGGTLVRLTTCSECRKTLQKKCDLCNNITEQFHAGCKEFGSVENPFSQFHNIRVDSCAS